MQLRKWYKNLELHSKAIFWFVVANMIQKGAIIIGTPIFTRIMSKSEYGITTVYQSWLNIFTVFVSLNLSYGVFSKGLEKFENDRFNFAFSIQSLSITLGAIWLVLFLIFNKYFELITGLNFKLLLVMFLSFLTIPIFDLWAAKQRYKYHYHKLLFFSIVNTFFSLIFPIIGILTFQDKALSKILFSNISLFFISLAIYFNELLKLKGKVCYKYWKYAINFNLPLIPYYLSMIILNHSDRIMIQKFYGDAEVGMYSVAHQISNIIVLLTSAITASFTPYIFQNIKNGKLKNIKKNIFKYIIIVGLMSLAIIAIAPEVMKVFASLVYYDAVRCIAPLVLACFLQFSYSFFGTIEFYFEKTWFTLIISVISTIVNISLNIIFLPTFGYITCTYTTLVSFGIMSIGHFMFSNYLCKKKLGQKVYNSFSFYIINFGIITLGFTISYLYTKYLLRYCLFIIIIFIALYNFLNKSNRD